MEEAAIESLLAALDEPNEPFDAAIEAALTALDDEVGSAAPTAEQALRAAAEEARKALAGMIAETTPDAASRERIASTLAAWRTELRDQRSRAAEEYNFAELAKSVRDPRSPVAGKPEAQIRLQVLGRMQGLFGWMATTLQGYSREKPLVVHELSGTAPKEIKVFVGADRRLYYAEGGAIRQRNWSELRPPVMAAIIAGAMQEAQPFPPREAVLGAQAFAGFYGLPELMEALRKNRPKRMGK